MTCTVSRNNKYVDKNELTIENLIRKNIVLTYLSKFDIMKKKERMHDDSFLCGQVPIFCRIPTILWSKNGPKLLKKDVKM